MRTVEIIIPWRGGCPYRQLVLDWVRAAWEANLHVVRLGELDPGREWCKAEAVAAALRESTADDLIIADADVWCFHSEMALDHLGEFRWAMPFREVRRLTAEATSVALQSGDMSGSLTQRAYLGVAGGGMMAISREDYERVPLDPRFKGWGQEDESWGIALRRMLGDGWRGSEPLYHLWHPPMPRQNRAIGSNASRELRNRYFRARPFTEDMERLLAEARAAV